MSRPVGRQFGFPAQAQGPIVYPWLEADRNPQVPAFAGKTGAACLDRVCGIGLQPPSRSDEQSVESSTTTFFAGVTES